MEEDGVRLAKVKEGGSRVLERDGRLKLELRCMAGKPSCVLAAPPRWTLPPLWHLLFSTVVHTREP